MREGAASISFPLLLGAQRRRGWIGSRLLFREIGAQFLKLPGALQEAPLPLRCSSGGAEVSTSLSICWAAILRAFIASFGLRFIGCDPERPNSTSRRIVSDHEAVSFRAAHFSIAAVSSTGRRMAKTGLRPVAGRPRFFDMTFLDFAII